MRLQLIRNATIKLNYGGRIILVDPFFSPMHAVDSFAGISKNPTVGMPFSPVDAMDGVETIIVTHLHPDHFDPVAQALIPNDFELLCQPGDEATLRQIGFTAAMPVAKTTELGDIKVTRTPGRHGSGEWARQMGSVSGFILETPDEPKIYIAGDTIYYGEIKDVIHTHKPEVIVTNSGGAEFPGSGPIIMDGEQTVNLTLDYPHATVVAIHIEALDHCPVTREKLRSLANEKKISEKRLHIPDDGQSISL